MKVELLKSKRTYKGKDFYDFFIKLDNGLTLSINVNALFSANVENSTKYRILNDLMLVACDYEKKQKDTK